LVAVGIGKIGIADFDTVSVSNLHRQILYTPSEIGQLKALIAAQKLQLQNPDCQIIAITKRIASDNVFEFLADYDLVVDATDNFDTRYLLNDACVLSQKPLVYGAIYQFEGQVAVWNVKNDDGSYSPHYRDIFPEVEQSEVPNCAEGGVIPTIAGIIGCMQANEVVKYFTKIGNLLVGKILILDALTLQSRIIKTASQSNVKVNNIVQTINIQTITITDFLKNKDNFTIIDVRKEEERAIFDIGGLHFPLSVWKEKCKDFTFEKPLVLYCASGKRSAEAAQMFLKHYPTAAVYSLEGGIKRYQEYLNL
jgi:adenylyltransferase/sulfurtransferase